MMNKVFLYIVVCSGLLWASCDEQVFDPVLNVGPASSLTTPSSGASFVLEEDQAAQAMTTFEWTRAEFGFSAAVTYTLEIDFAGSNFGSAVTLGSTTALSMAVTQEKVNNILLAAGIEQAEPVTMEVRVVSEINDDVEPTISAPVSLTITPFIVEVIFPQLQVPGSYQGWDPANNQTVIYSLKSDGKFEGFIYFDADGALYKFTDGPSWDINWGDDGLDGTLERNGTDIPIPVLGMYRLNVDLNALTHSSVKTDWGVIGDATPGGWDADQDMVYQPETGTLTLTLDLTAGALKFRANDAWDINLGDDDANGSLEYNGADIIIEDAGNYSVELILNVPKYTYNLTKN